jgi:predicted deacylase
MTSPTTKANKAEVMITSSTHGNEIATPEVTMFMINEILSKYGSDARFTTMLETHVLYFIPVLSPDGYVYESREISGLDPNRDYPWPSDPEHQSVATIGNETKWFATKHIVGSADIHSNFRAVMYPWAYTDQPVSDPNDLQRFETISSQMGQDTGFQYGPIYTTIYPAPGSSADYWYWKFKTIALGFEMGGEDFAPPSSELPRLINEVVPSLYHFIEYF